MPSEEVDAVALGATKWWSLRNVLQQAGRRACEADDMETATEIAVLHKEIKRQTGPEAMAE